jgi:hypothetical protein
MNHPRTRFARPLNGHRWRTGAAASAAVAGGVGFVRLGSGFGTMDN